MIKALPSSIASQVERIEQAIAAWPIPVSVDQAVQWVLQFDRDDYGLAIRILEHIAVLSQANIRSAFAVAQAKLERVAAEKDAPIRPGNTLYAGVGHAAKSGALMAYHYRLAASVSANNFFVHEEGDDIDFAKVENIVLLDDVIGTGDTVVEDVTEIAPAVHSLLKTRNLFVLTVAGYDKGVAHVVEKTGASVIAALEYASSDTVTDLDATFYAGLPMAERARTLDRIKRYCRICTEADPRFALGYGNIGGLLVFDHNTPNTTLPLIWARGNGWRPLFPRAPSIDGWAKVLKAAEAEIRNTGDGAAAAAGNTSRDATELTLFVEGKYDEIFVDVLRNRLQLASRLEVADIKAVSLGGLIHSERLAELLGSSQKYAVFLLENDRHSRRLAQRIPQGPNIRILFLRPSLAALLDIDKVFAYADRFPGLPDSPDGQQAGAQEHAQDERWFRDFEVAVLKRGNVTARSEKLAQVIEEFLSPSKYDEFVKELKEQVDDLFMI